MVGIAFEAIPPPVWISGWPKADTPTPSGFTVRMETDMAGIGYYVVVADGAAAPSVAQVKAGQDSTGAAALKSGSLALTANTENSVAVTGLTGNTAYDVYFVATGTANNDQTSVTKKDVQTLVRGTVVTIQ
jgi:hypothetical protein